MPSVFFFRVSLVEVEEEAESDQHQEPSQLSGFVASSSK
jgi:hypothetical protein